MNSTSNEASGTQLPPPHIERAPASTNVAERLPVNTESSPEVSEKAHVPQPTVPALMQALAPPVLPVAKTDGAQQDQTSSVSVGAHLQVSDDGDLIEKEWVEKAKQIVEKTRDDPYKQTEELTVFKADYMQKRYGKTIKLNQ